MAKIGVGVGDEFPIDEGKPREETPGSNGNDRHDEWRDRRREWKRRWREHHARYGRDPFHYWHHSARLIWPALFIIGGIALLIAIISHFFYVFLGAAVLAVLYVTHRNHHDAMWDMHPRSPSSAPEQK